MSEQVDTDHPNQPLASNPLRKQISGFFISLAVLTYTGWVFFTYWLLQPPPIRHALYWIYFVVWITGCCSLIGLLTFRRWWVKLAWLGTTLIGWMIIFVPPAFLLPPPPFSGDLLADALWKGRIIVINLPEFQGHRDLIQVLDDHRVAFQLRPDPYSTEGRTIPLNDNQWMALANLQETWCATPPPFSSAEMPQPVYEVAIQCHRNANPVFRISPDQLPQPLQSLITVISQQSVP